MKRDLEQWVGPNSGENDYARLNYKGPYMDQVEINATKLNLALKKSQAKLILASACCPYSWDLSGILRYICHTMVSNPSGTIYSDSYSIKDIHANCRLVIVYDRSVWEPPKFSNITPESCANRINCSLFTALSPLRYMYWFGPTFDAMLRNREQPTGLQLARVKQC